MSSRDFNGQYGPAGGRGADGHAGGAWSAARQEIGHRVSYARGGASGPGRSASGYADPGGWGDDGYWREPDGGHGDTGLAGVPTPKGSPTQVITPGQVGAPGRGRHGGGPGGRAPGGGPGGPGGGPGGPRGPRGYDRGPGRGSRRAGRNAVPRVKVKGSWWRHWSLKKVAGVLAATMGSFFLLLAGVVYYTYTRTPVPTEELAANQYQQSVVYASDGKTVIGKFGGYNRHLVPLNQIPQIMQDAVLAAEDRSFWTEGGVSPTGVVRAAYADIFGGGNSLQGGSTITQQFVRQYYTGIGTQQTMSRKIKEIFVSMKIAKEKSKQWILQQYLNTIYLGDGAYGVDAAAQTYFGIPVQQVGVAQAAVIAAIIQSPTFFPQPQYRTNLEVRWHYVLSGLVKMGDLTAAQAATMKFPKFSDTPAQTVGSAPWDPYILNQVKNELLDVYHVPESKIDNGGLKIVTTISNSMSAALYHAVNYNKMLMRQDGGALPWYALIGAELQNPQTGAIVAEYPGQGQNMSPKQCAKYDCDNNTAAYSREQVGSSFKPWVLMQAVKEGMNVKTSILNGFSPLWIPLDSQPAMLAARSQATAQQGWFRETNDNHVSLGPLTVANAEAQSSNTAFTDLIHRVGTQNVVNLAAQMGVDTASSGLQTDIGHVGMALGQDSLTVNEQDTMLSAIANGGMYHQAHVVKEISGFPSGGMTAAKFSSAQALTPAQDSQVQYAMSFDTVNNGTGTAAAMSDGRPIIAKTGTTDNFHSAFFIGAIPQYSLTVGIFTQEQGDKVLVPGHGYKPNTETLNGLGGNTVGGGFGGYWPARIWHTFAEEEFARLPVQQFLSPIFTGAAWNQVGFLPKPQQKHHKKQQHQQQPPPPPPPPHHRHHHPGSVPTPPGGKPSLPVTGAAATAPGALGVNVTGTAAAGGVLVLLPGTLLWTRLSRRRGRRNRPVRTQAGSP
ncbi:MAG: penicillin-binding protein [Streptosporangiaceae bacterium]|nr:penicillin-binding protein [Streptosporangiaceae bacterium]MBV9856561.1 penicillin-binding protein [Streptosporangiaceae bacterium]